MFRTFATAVVLSTVLSASPSASDISSKLQVEMNTKSSILKQTRKPKSNSTQLKKRYRKLKRSKTQGALRRR